MVAILIFFFVRDFLQIKHVVLLLFMSQFFIISLLQFIIQLLFQLFCMTLQCLALDRNYLYFVIPDFLFGIISFGFCF